MHFYSKEVFSLFLCNLKEIGIGSQGVCYLDEKNKKVYKVFHQYFDSDEEFNVIYKREALLKFSKIKNNTFIWPCDVIVVRDEVVGYISDYVNAKPLYSINPLNVELKKFLLSVKKVINDIEIISENGVITYDMMYNVLYGRRGIFVIDTDDYAYSSKDRDKIFQINRDNFNKSMMYFLVDDYYDEFILDNKILKEMYSCGDIDIEEFILFFSNSLSEYIGKDIVRLRDASKCINKTKILKPKYQRTLFSDKKNIDYR